MKISKELFSEMIQMIQEQNKMDDAIGDAMSKYTGSFAVFGDTHTRRALMKLLKEVTGDADDYISWWLYENVEKKVWLKDGTEIKLKTAESLYDFLKENY